MITSLQLQPKTSRSSKSVSVSPPKQMMSCDEKQEVEIKKDELQNSPRSEGEAINGNLVEENAKKPTLSAGEV